MGICIQNVVDYKCKVAENGKIQVKYEYPNTVLK